MNSQGEVEYPALPLPICRGDFNCILLLLLPEPVVIEKSVISFFFKYHPRI